MSRGSTPNQNTTPPATPAAAPAPADPAAPGDPAAPPAAAEQTASRAAARRRDAYENVKPADRSMVDALLVERNGYVQRDLKDRVRQVDEQLRLRGYRAS